MTGVDDGWRRDSGQYVLHVGNLPSLPSPLPAEERRYDISMLYSKVIYILNLWSSILLCISISKDILFYFTYFPERAWYRIFYLYISPSLVAYWS